MPKDYAKFALSSILAMWGKSLDWMADKVMPSEFGISDHLK